MAVDAPQTSDGNNDYSERIGGNRPYQGPSAGTPKRDRYIDCADQAHPQKGLAHGNVQTVEEPFTDNNKRTTFQYRTQQGTVGGRDGDWDDRL